MMAGRRTPPHQAGSWSCREVTDPAAWDQLLLALPNPHILQSWTWGQFKSRHGWTASRLVFEEAGQVVAAASVLQRKLPRLPVSILYASKGPALDWEDSDRAHRVLAELERLARQRRALFVKIDPDVYFPEKSTTPLTDAASNLGAPNGTFLSRPGCAPQTAHLLAERGWCLSDEQIQFRNTVLLDLRGAEAELLAAMKQKSRYNVRLAGRRGVTVRRGMAADMDTFYRLYRDTAQREGFLIRPIDYYLDAWGSFLERDKAHLLLAEVEGEAVAGLILFTFGPTAWYMYGASSGLHRKLMPNNLLQWEAIRQAKAVGCILYDLWGAPERLDNSDPMWGVVRFKLGLGGRLARGLGAWDYAPNGPAYRFYTSIMPRYLSWLRRGSGTDPNQAGRTPVPAPLGSVAPLTAPTQ
jgi:peptidoglycan pentaglycine glycine transferase (the first glycine)